MTTVSVTAGHIAKGWPGDCGWCPVALAIADTFPGLAYLTVGYLDIAVRSRSDEDAIVIQIPDEALAFIRTFDSDQPVEPFAFDLNYPEVAA